jgi:hypothetical protein
VTGGSDFHGKVLGSELGSITVPWAVWDGLRRRHLRLLSQSGSNLRQMAPGTQAATSRRQT